MDLFSLSFSLFLLMDSIGNIPLYTSLLKNLPPQRQRKVIIRELIIALFVIILFSFLGEGLINFLNISESSVEISGGIILFLICLKMIFPSEDDEKDKNHLEREPLIVPLAVPFIAGPAILSAIIIYSKQSISYPVLLGAIFIAWLASLLVLLSASYLKKLLGTKGILAMERLMGLILTMISVQMLLNGLQKFLHL